MNTSRCLDRAGVARRDIDTRGLGAAVRLLVGVGLLLAVLGAAEIPAEGIISRDSKAGPPSLDPKAEGLPPFVVSADKYHALALPSGTLGALGLLLGGLLEPPHLNFALRRGRVITPMRMDQLPERVAARTDMLASTVAEGDMAITLESALRVLPSFGIGRRTDTLAVNRAAEPLSLRGAGRANGAGGLALFDGISVNDPFDGSVSWAKLPRATLEHVELVPGGGAAAWGDGAGGGVLQVFIPPPRLELAVIDQPPAPIRTLWRGTLQLTATAGDFDTRTASLTLVRPFRRGILQVLAEQFSTGGANLVALADRGSIDGRASSRHQSVTVRWNMPIGAKLDLIATARAFDGAANDGTPLADHGAREAFVSLALHGEASDAFSWAETMYGQQDSSHRASSVVNLSRTGETPLVDQFAVPTAAIGGSWVGTWAAPDGARTLVGTDLRMVHGESRERLGFNGETFARQRLAGGRQAFIGAFVLREQPMADDWRLSAGGRFDRWADQNGHMLESAHSSGAVLSEIRPADRDGTETSLNAGVVWRATEQVRVRAHVQHGYRLPTLEQLYGGSLAEGRAVAPNFQLAPEHRTTAEISAQWSQTRDTAEGVMTGPGTKTAIIRRRVPITIQAGVFWSDVRDFMAISVIGDGNRTDPVPAGWIKSESTNLDRAAMIGAEISANLEMTRSFSLGMRWVGQIAAVRKASAAPLLEQKHLVNAADHSAALFANWHAPGNIVLRPRLRWLGREWWNAENTVRLGEAVVVDVGVSRALTKNLELFLTVENAADAPVDTGRGARGVRTVGTPRFAFGGVRGHW